MRKFTKLMLTLALLVVGVGGAKATVTNGTLRSIFGATWNSSTHTMTWEATEGYTIIGTDFPSDISKYTKFHATLSDFSENADFVRLRIKDKGGHYADANLVAGENFIDLVALKAAKPSCDFSNLEDITIWGSTEATEGHTINHENPASVVIKDVYLFDPVKTTYVATGFGDAITSLDYITGTNETDAQKFVISDNGGTKAKYFKKSNENENADVANVPSDAYFYFTLEKYNGGDIPNTTSPADNIYRIKITNAAGEGYPRGTSGGYYLNAIKTYNSTVIAGPEAGWSEAGNELKDALWYVTYNAENGFSFQNVYRIENSASSWLSIGNNFVADQQYLKLYKNIEFEESTDLEKVDNPANDEIFALADATGYNAETGILKDGGWTFATPVDLSDWDYLVITVENTSRSTDTNIRITDNSGKYVERDQYDPGSQPQMYFGTWNNHNAACISMDYLRKEKELDIFHIKSLSFSGQELKISSVYLTDYENTKLGPSRGRYVYYAAGDVVRSYDSEGVGKFGTICLPYVASCAGAEVYSIEGKVGNSLTLNKVTGLLEAGKPYFYKASDVTGKKDADVHNVNFFRADLAKFDAASAGTANGLVGTFSAITAPENSYVLSNNRLYKVDSEVNVGANKAYVDLNAITTPSLARGNVFIDFDEPTGIKTVKGSEEMSKESVFFDLQGRRVAQPVKGLYIVNGKKVMVK